MREFLDTEAAGGAVLLAAAVAAFVWANSPWSASYRSLWSTEFSVGVGRFVLTEDLQHWVNDGLMAIFFFVVGLEVKRELVHGELREARTVAMPVLAAVGGMAVPALVFLVVTAGTAGSGGWGIPMATDIAFAVGVVALLGPRIPPSLKLFLLTLAIVDDIGAIVVIAVFYAGEVEPVFLGTAAMLLLLMLGLRRAGIVWAVPYAVLGLAVWLATQASGVHATIAGVVLGLLTPARSIASAAATRAWAGHLADDPTADDLADMTAVARTSVSPAERLEHLLHPWTSFVVIPVFALANAGVAVGADLFDTPGSVEVAMGVALGLIVGKVVGITLAVWIAVRCGFGRLPDGATWPMVMGIGAIGGIGFTVSLFISELAFASGPLQEAAKVGVLAASLLAAVLGALLLRRAVSTAGD
ncbi:MAG TPA: Na+/H+ antiporter NhaA [Acidimicrobiales bacterium]|nr:Na+/H+ antiporter NhaA [Acidimicrobiales bacterium]